jgi:hypothetical protein
MSAYLQNYGAGEEAHARLIKRLVLGLIAVVILGVAAYFYFQDFKEERLTKQFLGELNEHRFDAAYRTWGCTEAQPCRDYGYQKFLDDWGPQKANGDWKVKGVDGCSAGVIVMVAARGTEATPIWVEQSASSLTFSPWDQCPGKRWRFKQFFQRIFGR